MYLDLRLPHMVCMCSATASHAMHIALASSLLRPSMASALDHVWRLGDFRVTAWGLKVRTGAPATGPHLHDSRLGCLFCGAILVITATFAFRLSCMHPKSRLPIKCLYYAQARSLSVFTGPRVLPAVYTGLFIYEASQVDV